jgi:hypothetical protein
MKRPPASVARIRIARLLGVELWEIRTRPAERGMYVNVTYEVTAPNREPKEFGALSQAQDRFLWLIEGPHQGGLARGNSLRRR